MATIRVTRKQILEASKGMLQKQFYVVFSNPDWRTRPGPTLPSESDHRIAPPRGVGGSRCAS